MTGMPPLTGDAHGSVGTHPDHPSGDHPAFSDRLTGWREVAHNAIAVLGAVAAGWGTIVGILASLGVSIPADRQSLILGGIGALVTLGSKVVDSSFERALETAPVVPHG